MKVLLILNPTSQSGKGKKKWQNLFGLLEKKQIAFDVSHSTYAGHSIALAKEGVLSNQYDSIVAVGGDGTINEVLNGMMLSGQDFSNLPSLGILYTGTSPDICRFHNISLYEEIAVDLLAKPSRLIDVGEIEQVDEFGNIKKNYFLCSVNLGIGASVARGSNTGLRKYLGDFLGTLISLLISLIKFKKSKFNCIVDGTKKDFPETINLCIGKNPYIASGIKVDLEILPDDGKMYLFHISRFSLIKLIFNLRRLYNGKLFHHPYTKLELIKSFECLPNQENPEVEFDGDPQGQLPCKIKILNKVLRLHK